jgi:hypothetical protein
MISGDKAFKLVRICDGLDGPRAGCVVLQHNSAEWTKLSSPHTGVVDVSPSQLSLLRQSAALSAVQAPQIDAFFQSERDSGQLIISQPQAPASRWLPEPHVNPASYSQTVNWPPQQSYGIAIPPQDPGFHGPFQSMSYFHPYGPPSQPTFPPSRLSFQAFDYSVPSMSLFQPPAPQAFVYSYRNDLPPKRRATTDAAVDYACAVQNSILFERRKLQKVAVASTVPAPVSTAPEVVSDPESAPAVPIAIPGLNVCLRGRRSTDNIRNIIQRLQSKTPRQLYRCRKCGEVKKGHLCEYDVAVDSGVAEYPQAADIHQ